MSGHTSALIFEGDETRLALRFRPASRPTESFKKEIELAASRIAKIAQKPIWVCLSGGIDSELICEAFHNLKVPFKVLTVAHQSGTNENDIVWAKKWCEAHAVEQKILTFDADAFFADYVPRKLAEGFYSPCPFRFFQLYLMEHIDSLGGFGVLGVGEQRYFLNETSKEAFLDLDSGLHWVQKYAGDRHVPFFFYSTPEIMLAYMETPQVDTTLRHPEILAHKENVFLLKRMVYQTYFPHLKTRDKLDGWEGVALEFAIARSRLQKQANGRPQYFQITARELENQLRGRS